MADSTPKSYSTDPSLYLYTSLSSGSSHIVTATARLETILRANGISFKALDVATDEKARMLWGRRAGKRKLPGLDLDEVEEWNEYGEIEEQLGSSGPAPATSTVPSTLNTPSKPPPTKAPTISTSEASARMSEAATTPAESTKQQNLAETPSKSSASGVGAPFALAMRQAGLEAAEKAKSNQSKPVTSSFAAASTTSTAPIVAVEAKRSDAGGSKPAPGLNSPNKLSEVSPSTTLEKNPSDPRADATGTESPIPTTSSVSNEPLAPSSATNIKSATLTDAPVPAGAESTKHRGSSIGTASKEAIQELEMANRIEENPEEEKALEKEGNVAEEMIGQRQEKDGDLHLKIAGEHGEVADDSVKKAAVAPVGKTEAVDKGPSNSEASLEGGGLGEEPTGSEKAGVAAEEGVGMGSEVQKAIEATDSDALQDMSGTKTQDQGAADSEKAGESVGD